MRWTFLSGIRPSFPGLSQSQGQVTHVLLTRSPLIHPASWASSFDLHVLSTPPAFILSQDQTLRKKNYRTTSQQPEITTMTSIQYPADHHHTTGVVSDDQPICVKTIGINKLGTLLSSQTTGASSFSDPLRGPFRSGATSPS